jgi:hypothetical protein
VPKKPAASTIHFLPGVQAGDREKKTCAGIFLLSVFFPLTAGTIALFGGSEPVYTMMHSNRTFVPFLKREWLPQSGISELWVYAPSQGIPVILWGVAHRIFKRHKEKRKCFL